MKKEFKAGDKVSDLRHGNGIVEAINSNSYCPVFVLFPSKRTEVYMADGRERESDLAPMLYHGHDLIFEAREPVSIPSNRGALSDLSTYDLRCTS